MKQLRTTIKTMLLSLRQPWKVTLVTIIISGLITAVLQIVMDGGIEQIGNGLVISTICSAPISYVVSRVYLRYRDTIEAQNRELLAANDELDTFVHTVAHDLKAPLATILGYSHLAQDMYNSGEEIGPLLERMRRIGDNMLDIIDELLTFSQIRRQEIEVTPVNMAAIIGNARERLAYLIEDTNAHIEVSAELPPALGYGPWLEEVWTNYLSNALKYGGSPPVLQLGADCSNGVVEYWVRDNGPGISVKDQARLFTEFSRLPHNGRTANGSGLGLSIVHRIVTRLDGQVGVESQVGEGSRFYFRLRAVEGKRGEEGERK
jgi:signal transduction histidine kinase